MARPAFNGVRAMRLLTAWVDAAAEEAPDTAPITVSHALAYLKSKRMPVNRATFYKYKLHDIVTAGAARQAAGPGARAATVERRTYEQQVSDLRARIETLERGNRTQLGVIATMTFNARRLGITDDELNRPMPVPDRTAPRTGGGRRPSSRG